MKKFTQLCLALAVGTSLQTPQAEALNLGRLSQPLKRAYSATKTTYSKIQSLCQPKIEKLRIQCGFKPKPQPNIEKRYKVLKLFYLIATAEIYAQRYMMFEIYRDNKDAIAQKVLKYYTDGSLKRCLYFFVTNKKLTQYLQENSEKIDPKLLKRYKAKLKQKEEDRKQAFRIAFQWQFGADYDDFN